MAVQLLQPGMQLDLGGIAQGYIGQQVIDFLKTKNIVNALVDVSGDIVAMVHRLEPMDGPWALTFRKKPMNCRKENCSSAIKRLLLPVMYTSIWNTMVKNTHTLSIRAQAMVLLPKKM